MSKTARYGNSADRIATTLLAEMLKSEIELVLRSKPWSQSRSFSVLRVFDCRGWAGGQKRAVRGGETFMARVESLNAVV